MICCRFSCSVHSRSLLLMSALAVRSCRQLLTPSSSQIMAVMIRTESLMSREGRCCRQQCHCLKKKLKEGERRGRTGCQGVELGEVRQDRRAGGCRRSMDPRMGTQALCFYACLESQLPQDILWECALQGFPSVGRRKIMEQMI